MAFDPLSWLFSFSLGRAATGLLSRSADSELAKKLRHAASDWAAANRDRFTVRTDTLELLFRIEHQHPQELSAAQMKLADSIRNHLVPSSNELQDALLERWNDLRNDRNPDELVDFLQLPLGEAEHELADLAEKLRRVLQQDERFFRATTPELLESLGGEVTSLRMLLERIDAERRDLQNKLDEERQRSTHYTTAVKQTFTTGC